MRNNRKQRTIKSHAAWLVSFFACLAAVFMPSTAHAALAAEGTLNTDLSEYLNIYAENTHGEDYGSITFDGNVITVTANGRNTGTTTTTLYIFAKNQNVDITYDCAVYENSDTASTVEEGLTFTAATTSSPDLSIISARQKTHTYTLKVTITSVTPVTTSYYPTFAAPENGSYTVDGVDVEETYTLTDEQLRDDSTYPLVATPDKDYAFYGWRSDVRGYLSYKASFNYVCGATETITPVFVPANCAVYRVSDTNYVYLDEAIEAAEDGDGLIIVYKSGTAYGSEGQTEFTIPSGVTLLVPCNGNDKGALNTDDDSNAIYPKLTNLGSTYDNYLAPIYNPDAGGADSDAGEGEDGEGDADSGSDSDDELGDAEVVEALDYSYAYRTLTVPSGTVINVASGAVLKVNAHVFASGTCDANCPNGPYGMIVLEEDAEINLLSGSTAFCYGFIIGTFDAEGGYTGGKVNAMDGANVYELLQLRDWRGGTATMRWMNQGTASFPFSQFYVQNIEAEYVIYPGADSNVVGSLVASGSLNQTSATFIGDSGLFRIASGRLVRIYEPGIDRIKYTVERNGSEAGEASMDGFTMSFAGQTLNTADHILGLNNNISFNVASGASLTLNSKIKLLPNAEIVIEEGADATVASGGALYIYDVKDWITSYTRRASESTSTSTEDGSNYYYDNRRTQREVVRYSPSREIILDGAPIPTRDTNNFISAKVVVNGTMTANGNVFTTAGYTTGTSSSSTLGGVYLTGLTLRNDAASADKVLMGTGTFINNKVPESTNYYYYQKKTSTLIGSTVSGEWHTSRPKDSSGFLSSTKYTQIGTDLVTYGALDEFYSNKVRVMQKCLPVVGMIVNEGDNGLPTEYESFGADTYQGHFIVSNQNGVETSGYYWSTEDNNVTLHLVDPSTKNEVSDPWDVYIPNGTKLDAYYLDADCTTPVTSYSGQSDLWVLAAARVDWDSGADSTYYLHLELAAADALLEDSEVHVLRDIGVTSPIQVDSGKRLEVYLDGHMITYASTVFNVSGTLDLDMKGGTIINHYACDEQGGVYSFDVPEVSALVINAGGELNLDVNGGSLGWKVPAEYIQNGYDRMTTSSFAPVYGKTGSTVDIDLTSGEIYVDHDGALSKDETKQHLNAVINYKANMEIHGNADGKGVIWSTAFSDSPSSYASSDGSSCYVTPVVRNYGAGNLVIDGVTIRGLSDTVTASAALFSYYGGTMSVENTTIENSVGYAIYNRSANISEITDCALSGLKGICNNSGTIDTIGGNTTITITGNYGIYNTGTIDTIGGNGSITISGAAGADYYVYGIYVASGGLIEDLGVGTGTINIRGRSYNADYHFRGIYVCDTGKIVNIANSRSTLNIEELVLDTDGKTEKVGAAHGTGIYVNYEGEVENIGNGGTINITALYGIRVVNTSSAAANTPTTVGTIGNGGTINIYDAQYGLYFAGSSSTKVTNIGTVGASGSINIEAYESGIRIHGRTNITSIAEKGCTITIGNGDADSGDGIYVLNTAAVTNMGNGGSIIIDSNNGIYVTADGNYKPTITNLGTSGTITITAKNHGIYVLGKSSSYKASITTLGSADSQITITQTAERDSNNTTRSGIYLKYANVGTMGGNIKVNATGRYGIYLTTSATVTDLGIDAGTLISRGAYYGLCVGGGGTVTTLSGAGQTMELYAPRYGVYCSGTIGEIGNGAIIRSSNTGTSYGALYVTDGGSVCVTGGYYRHASGKRAYTIVVDDDATLTYPAGYSLSKTTVTKTLPYNGTSKVPCYYITYTKPAAGTVSGKEEPVEVGTLAQAIAAYFEMADNSDSYVILTDNCTETGSIKLTDDLYIDLSGYNLDVSGFDIDYGEDTNGNAYNLYIIDSGTNAYLQNANDQVGNVILGENTVSNAKVFTVKHGASSGKHYVQVDGESGGLEFHRAATSVTTIQYTPGQDYAVFQGIFRGTDSVVDALEDLGFRFNESTDVWYGLTDNNTVTYDMAFSYACKLEGVDSVQALLSFAEESSEEPTEDEMIVSILRDGIAGLIKEASE